MEQLRKLIREEIQKIFENTETHVIDKYGDKLKVDKAWSGFKFPIPEFKTKVKDSLVHIITNKRQISEKSWSAYDNVIKEVGDFFKENPETFGIIEKFELENKRAEYCAEFIFGEYFMPQELNEAKKSKFEKLKDNKIPLTDEERKKVMDADAVWHFSHLNKPTPAVWKSKDKKGKISYVCHTHRAYQVRPTLKGAISIFHSFIKGTS